MISFISFVKDGKISSGCSLAIKTIIQKMDGKTIEITISEKKKKRSLKQNAYRYKVIVGTVKDRINQELKLLGEREVKKEEIDLFIKDKALGMVHRVNTSIGELTLIDSLKDADASQFEEAMEQIRAYFAEKGIEILLPNEHLNGV